MVRGGGRPGVRLARPVQVDEVAQARGGVAPAQPDLAGTEVTAGTCGQPCRRPHERNHCAGFRRAIPGSSGGPLRTPWTWAGPTWAALVWAAGPNAAIGTVTNRG